MHTCLCALRHTQRENNDEYSFVNACKVLGFKSAHLHRLYCGSIRAKLSVLGHARVEFCLLTIFTSPRISKQCEGSLCPNYMPDFFSLDPRISRISVCRITIRSTRANGFAPEFFSTNTPSDT
ncbi:hypothetical protein ACS0PU_008625 [Formica fusca]